MSLSSIPDVSFVETDADVIFNNIKTAFEKNIGRTLYPGDPLIILLQTFTLVLSQQANKFEYTAKQNLLKYSDNGYIENLGALVGVSRLQPSSAFVTLKFNISEAQPGVVLIPAGTRVSTGNKIYFATTKDIEILSGEVEVIVVAECEEPGTVGNDFRIGEINQIVDLFDYYDSVENTTISSGGSDLESLEKFRERIFDAPNSFSVAGPEAAYEYWAKSTNASISDVSVYSPEPGVVELIPLLNNGVLPTDEILQEVYDFCSADERRPLTDFVVVKAPTIKNYNVDIVYFVSRSNANNQSNIDNLAKSVANEYVLWQKSSLGRDINPSKLQAMIMETGVKRLVVNEPNFEVLNYNEVAICGNVNVIFGGLENE